MVNRKVYGYEVPEYSREEIQQRFGIPVDDPVYTTLSGENCWILPFISEQVSVLAVTVNVGDKKEVVTQRRITDAAYMKFGKKPWYDALQYAGLEVNGQVKNFLVALRTFHGDSSRKSVRVLIKGSKAASDSGLWIKSYGLYLTTMLDEVQIACYDKGETPGEDSFNLHYGRRVANLTITRFADYYDGNGTGYDVFIDDAFVDGPIKVAPKSEYYSLKQPGAGEPFFAAREVRRFSHDLGAVLVKVDCQCQVCSMLSKIATTFDVFNYLRAALVSFGAPVCNNQECRGDMQAKFFLRKDLHTEPSVLLITPYQQRAAIALSLEEPMKLASGPLDVQLAPTPQISPSDYTHKVGFASMYEAIEYSYFTGKNVRFIGVDPGILGTTKLDLNEKATISIGTNLEMLLLRPTNEIWCPVASILGYERGQGQLGSFNQFIKNKRHTHRLMSKFSDVAGATLDCDIESVRYTGGRYNISQTVASVSSVPLTPPILNLRGVLSRSWDGIRYCPKAKRSFVSVMPIIDQTIMPEVSSIVAVDDVKLLTSVTRKYVYFIKLRRTFEIQSHRVRGGCEFSSCDVIKDGKIVVYEYGLDKAIEALKSGMEINPGPDNHCQGNDWTTEEIWLMLRRHGWVNFTFTNGGSTVLVQFPLFRLYRVYKSACMDTMMNRIAYEAGNKMIAWAGSIDGAVVKWQRSNALTRMQYREQLTV